MVKISNEFGGGNAVAVKQNEEGVFIENELRDTVGDWFYWAFCAEGAEGTEVTFHFQKNRLGHWGPAVSHNLKNWHWLERCEKDCFSYRFSDTENKVYFAHDILYRPERFASFAKEHGLAVNELCKSRSGQSVPCVQIGDGAVSIILTARHHACESTGSYVLEGVLEEFLSSPIPDSRILCVPFVDFDGVTNGDQGKSRAPHDHNRDYTDFPIYPETAAIQAYSEKHGCNFGFDFHSPWHKGGENDNIFIVRNRADRTEEYDRFAELLEAECKRAENSMVYKKENDHPACTGWNMPSPNFSYTMHCRPECRLAFSLESTYFGSEENKVSQDRLISLGKAFARALRKYVSL